jgi:sugar-phosphatase
LSPDHPAPAGFGASIFDMDGLLIDSEVLWHEAEIEILGGLGVPLSADGCRTTKGMFVDEVTRHWHGLYPWTNGPSPDEVAVTIVDRVIALVRSKGRLKPGALAAIELCARRGLLLALASSSQYRLIDAALEQFGLRDRFDLVHSAEDEEFGKPHPAVFITAAGKLGVAPRHCLVWEDAPAGVLAAKAASMACIAVPEQGEQDHPAFGLADLVVQSLLEVDDGALDEVASRRFGPLSDVERDGPDGGAGLR